MRHILLISIFIGLTTAAYLADSCTYTNSEGSQFDFSQFGGWLNFTDGDSTWFINPCPQSVEFAVDDNVCAQIDGATLCKVLGDGKVSVRGQDNSSLWSDYTSSGVEVMYSSEEACYIDPLNAASSNYKTAIDFVCDVQNEMLASASIDNKADQCSLTTITIQTYYACPVIYEDSAHFEIETYDATVSFGFFVPIIAFIVALFVCCCCCCARRRRCRQQRICQQQFSNLAFQPVPSSTQATRPAVNGASFNPYVPQPQYYYYYPTQQTVHQQVPLENMPVATSDENMARQLQAQYDREAAQL